MSTQNGESTGMVCPFCGAQRENICHTWYSCGTGFAGLRDSKCYVREPLWRELCALRAALSDPAAVWANLLRETIAMPPHIPELEGRLTHAQVRIERLFEAGDALHVALDGSWNGSRRCTDMQANGALVGWNKAKEDKP